MPKISIIVPVYNVQPYLRECIGSIVRQTFRDIEIICVDDGSTDRSLSILAEYAATDGRVKVLAQTNGGSSTARNTGLAVATAPLVMFCDSDDWYAPTMCEEMFAAMQGNADIAICGVQEVTEERGAFTSGKYFDLPAEGEVDADDDMLVRCNVCPWNKIYHRDILECGQIRFPDGLRFEDEYFFATYTAYVQRIAFLPDKLYYYRRRGNSVMGRVVNGTAWYTGDYAHIANRIWMYHEERDLVLRRLSYLADIWLKLCALALNIGATPEECSNKEEEMVAFAETHIAPCSGMPSVAGQRLKLLMEHRWVGKHKHLGGFILSRCKEGGTSNVCVIKRKYYWMGMRCWTHRRVLSADNVRKSRQRILFCISRVVMGGVTKVLLQYLSAIVRLGGYDCEVVSTEPVKEEYFLSFFREHGIVLHVFREELPQRKRRGILSQLIHRCLRTKTRHATERETNELFSHCDVLINFEAWVRTFDPLVQHRRQQSIIFCHESFKRFLTFKPSKILTHYDHIVCLSHAFEHDFRQHFPEFADKVTCIYNPVDVVSIRNAAKQEVPSVDGAFFVAVQRLDRLMDKDVPTIIRAFRIFHERYPEYRLVIVGDGPMRQELEQLAAPETERGSIIFTGSLNNPYPLIRDAVALILSSTRNIGEGFGQVLVEAQALGVPAVSSNVPSGPAEVLLHGSAGYLFEAGNPSSLAQTMLRIVEFPNERENKVRCATKELVRFSPELCARKLLQLTYKT